MTPEQIASELEALEPLRQAIKARAMVYQADLKERAADYNGEPFDAYFDLPYGEWEVIRDKYLSSLTT